MVLIFGGAYQGKLAYAMDRFNLTESDVYQCRSDDVDMPENGKLIYEIDKWILALVEKDIDTGKTMQQFVAANGDKIVICNDISCGVVPIVPVLRKWREAVGRSLTMLSSVSDEVIRLFCAIPARVK